jgi:hypothetical protein
MATMRRVIASEAGTPTLEGVKQELYDTKIYPSAGTPLLEFFRNPSAGELLSNMQASGQLPSPQEYHALGIAVEIFPLPDETARGRTTKAWAEDKRRILEGALFKFYVGVKNYLTLPLMRIPEGMGTAGFGAGVDTILNAGQVDYFLTNGVQDINHFYDVFVRLQNKKKPIHIPAQQAFYAQITWPNLVPLDFSKLEYAKIRVYLIGVLWREVQ